MKIFLSLLALVLAVLVLPVLTIGPAADFDEVTVIETEAAPVPEVAALGLVMEPPFDSATNLTNAEPMTDVEAGYDDPDDPGESSTPLLCFIHADYGLAMKEWTAPSAETGTTVTSAGRTLAHIVLGHRDHGESAVMPRGVKPVPA